MYTYMGHARGRIWDRGAPTTTTTTDDGQDDRRRPTTTTTEPRVVGETSRDINTHDDDDLTTMFATHQFTQVVSLKTTTTRSTTRRASVRVLAVDAAPKASSSLNTTRSAEIFKAA